MIVDGEKEAILREVARSWSNVRSKDPKVIRNSLTFFPSTGNRGTLDHLTRLTTN